MFRPPIRLLLLLLVLLSAAPLARATTWNEPWHEQVVRQADVLVLARIEQVDEQKGLQLNLLRTLAGAAPGPGTLQVDNFYLLDICSTSGGHGPEFHFTASDTAYFFLKRNEAGNYSLATPTTGFADVRGTRVAATYRHSYHQALIDQPTYELTQTAIFQHYHGQPYAAAPIRAFIDEQLAQRPATIDEADMTTFFHQHVALETIFHLGLTDYYATLLPFLRDTANFHAQVSAARALTAVDTPAANEALLALLPDKATNDFSKVVAIQTLAAHSPRTLKPKLQQLAKKASAEEVSFGGNIMDPRVCTRLPSVKKALTELVASL